MTTHDKTHAPTAGTGPVEQGESSQYLTFHCCDELFAAPVLTLKEIIEYRSVTVVPMMPECVRGVINLRGAVVPVVDLSARLGRGPSSIGKRSCIVIVENSGEKKQQDLGLMVDAVYQVVDIPTPDIEPAPAFGAKIRSDFIQGMGKMGEKLVILLSLKQVLSMEELSLLTQAAVGAESGSMVASVGPRHS